MAKHLIPFDDFEHDSEQTLGNKMRSPSGLSFEDVEPWLDMLPPIEADILCLRFRDGMTQEKVAELMNCSQPAISYRSKRAVRRIQLYRTRPTVTLQEIQAAFHSGVRTRWWRGHGSRGSFALASEAVAEA